jgi:hypothetical protein
MEKVNLSKLILQVLLKYDGRPVVSQAVTRAVSLSEEAILWNAETKKDRMEIMGWTEELVQEEFVKFLNPRVLSVLGFLARENLTKSIRVERGSKVKIQIKKTGLVFDSDAQLRKCTIAYTITDTGKEYLKNSKIKQMAIRSISK